MKKINIISLITVIGFLIGTAGSAFAYGGYGTDVNSACAPAVPYSGDCLFCHASGSRSTPTPAKDAYLAGGTTLTNFFCPPVASCTDNDGDGYSPDGGTCGAVDCNDNDPAINSGAAEVCTDGFDNDCDGLIDNADPNAVGCPPVIIDNDGDGFTVTDGDCDDTDATVNPGAVELCNDGIDNNCNSLVDTQDPTAVDCPSCTDNDGDTYATEGGNCGQVDCDDTDASINPGGEEFCGDSIDNDCDGQVDEGCNANCPDVDGDGYLDAACGGNDCNDTDSSINPGAAEVCGDGVDSNCNGNSDEECRTCPDGTILIIKEMEYNQGDAKLTIKGRANYQTTITITNTDTGDILADRIRAREGKWNTTIKGLDDSLVTIRITTAEGCYTDRNLHNRGDNDNQTDEDVKNDENEKPRSSNERNRERRSRRD